MSDLPAYVESGMSPGPRPTPFALCCLSTLYPLARGNDRTGEGAVVMNDTEVLVCERVRKEFRDADRRLEVLSGVDLHVRSGERLSIVGASGSGKTTLLQILGGLDRPSGGKVRTPSQA